MQIGGERFFDEPFVKYFKKFLALNTKVELLIDSEQNLDIASSSRRRTVITWTSGISRRTPLEPCANYVFGKELAVNGIKILAEEGCEPCYVALRMSTSKTSKCSTASLKASGPGKETA